MHFSDNGFVVVCVIIGLYLVHCEYVKSRENESDKYDDFSEDIYSFVVLIDIVFTDSAKKTCTGTIIHDNVVITAAHCIKIHEEADIQAELTASFVVLGTRKMFEAGYEQYLPIERVIIHPNYKSWRADLALIHTFAGMVSDKPGRIVPIANEKTSTPVFSDVTVYSWSPFKLIDDDNKDTDEMYKVTSLTTFDSSNEEVTTTLPTRTPEILLPNKRRPRQRRKKLKMKLLPTVIDDDYLHKTYVKDSSIEARSKYHHQGVRLGRGSIRHFNTKAEELSWEKQKDDFEKSGFKAKTIQENRYKKKPYEVMSYYRNNWRRTMGDQHNKLTVEVFGFVNMQTCKKLIEKAMHSSYEIQNFNEVLCYSSEDHYITEADSGAPAMRRGHLVAVTVGGVDFEGERVAIGIKVSCFCSWISENIPKTGAILQCCKNCCEKKDDFDHNYMRRKTGS